ncbi:hypothetical protein ACFS5N_18405 [Mucilaginibacter ximonensis]|uniref:Uncharacterized protein n=1 Tax=Mucilaginibacter ximonensis TaxID=538021 RepID=A0ABW5YGN5_9SPHI
MSKVRRILTLFLLMPVLVSAQKAYTAVKYKAMPDTHEFYFTLGSGYLAASKIKLVAGGKSVLFYPDSNLPDDKDQLAFRANGHSDYFILNNMLESYDSLPQIIIARYWTNKRWRIIKLVLSR